MENKRKQRDSYDAIIIGSGIGGLAAAVFLTKMRKKRVLLIEQHYSLGGLTHVFRRRQGMHKWSFDTGIHYLGDMGVVQRALFHYITDGKIRWNQLPDQYDHYVTSKGTYRVPSGYQKMLDYLCTEFPHEKKGITKFVKGCKRNFAAGIVQGFMLISRNVLIRIFYHWLFRHMGLHTDKTTQQVLDMYIRDEHVKEVLASPCGDYGVSPKDSAYFTHSQIFAHYANGAFYPDGGCELIAKYAFTALDERGSDVLVDTKVDEIVIEKKRAVGVRIGDTVIRSKDVISCVGTYTTYMKLIPKEYPLPFRQELEDWKMGHSFVDVFIGFAEDITEKFGVKGNNFWLHTDGLPIGSVMDDEPQQRLLEEGQLPFLFMSFGSVNARLYEHGEEHTAQLLIPAMYRPWKKWADKPAFDRGEDYEAAKKRIADRAIARMDEIYPGISQAIGYVEVSTPLTTEHFIQAHEGQQYGLAATPKITRRSWIPGNHTPIKHLYLGGTGGLTLGIMGAIMGGVQVLPAMTPFPISVQGMTLGVAVSQYMKFLKTDERQAAILAPQAAQTGGK